MKQAQGIPDYSEGLFPASHRPGKHVNGVVWNGMGKNRAVLAIPDNYPTNPQAEVLMLEGVPRDYILGVIVPNIPLKNRLLARYPGLAVKHVPQYFGPRHDYIHWR